MDLELIFSEEESEPFAGQLLVVDADTDTSPERRERSRSRQISFPPEEELETVELIAPCYQRQQAVSAAAKVSAARCLQLLVQDDGKEVQRSATVQADNDAAGVVAPVTPVTPRRRRSTVFEMDEPAPAPAPLRQPFTPRKGYSDTDRCEAVTEALTEARVLTLWGCGQRPSPRARMSPRADPVLPRSKDAQNWVHHAWGWPLPPGSEQQQQQQQQQQQPSKANVKAPPSTAAAVEQQRAKVLSDWGCVPSVEEGIPPSSVGCHATSRELLLQPCPQSWDAVAQTIVTDYLAH